MTEAIHCPLPPGEDSVENHARGCNPEALESTMNFSPPLGFSWEIDDDPGEELAWDQLESDESDEAVTPPLESHHRAWDVDEDHDYEDVVTLQFGEEGSEESEELPIEFSSLEPNPNPNPNWRSYPSNFPLLKHSCTGRARYIRT